MQGLELARKSGVLAVEIKSCSGCWWVGEKEKSDVMAVFYCQSKGASEPGSGVSAVSTMTKTRAGAPRGLCLAILARFDGCAAGFQCNLHSRCGRA